MYIKRHEINPDLRNHGQNYDLNHRHVIELLDILRDPSRSDLLNSLGSSAEALCYNGMLTGQDPRVCAWGLQLSARAETSLFVFRCAKSNPRRWKLDMGLEVSFTKDVDRSHLHSSHWNDGLLQSLVTRQHDCLRELVSIPYDDLEGSSVEKPFSRDHHYVEEQRLLALAALDPGKKLGEEYLFHSNGSSPVKMPSINRRIGVALDQMVYAFDAGDSASFNSNLVEALKLRPQAIKKLKEEYRVNPSALWPLAIIGLVAMAYDRGMSIEVESDYLPREWVTGEYFHRTSADD